MSQKSGIIYAFSHNYARIKTNSFYALPLERALNLHNVTILINVIILIISF